MSIESMRSRELCFSPRSAICFVAVLVSLDASGFERICHAPELIAGEQIVAQGAGVPFYPVDDVTDEPINDVALGFNSHTHDIDQDGDTDIILLGNFRPNFGEWDGEPWEGRILINNGNYEFSVAKGDAPFTVQAGYGTLFADFDSNGYIDFFVGDGGYDANPFPGYPNSLMLQFEEGWVDASDRLPGDSGFTHDAALADVDGDGDLDIFVLSNGVRGEVADRKYWLINDGAANFEVNQEIMPDSLPKQNIHSEYWNVWSVAVEDLDGDGHVDMIFGANTRFDNLNRIFWGSPSGFSDDALTILDLDDVIEAVESEVYVVGEVFIFDANGDGLADIWISGGYFVENNRFSQLWMNAGDRQFVNQTASRISSLVNGEGSARLNTHFFDFNGDGHKDIVPFWAVSQENTALEAYAWLGDGNGFFTALTGANISPHVGNLGRYYVRSPNELYSFSVFDYRDVKNFAFTEVLQTSRVKTYPCPLAVAPPLIPQIVPDLTEQLISTFR